MKLALTQLARLHALSHHWLEHRYFGGVDRFRDVYEKKKIEDAKCLEWF